ncbi:DUF1266 domain-containing protein [Gordonia sp. VNK21]|uniref:DUF1266 domain-containing protein n=1 Tax=Gordonia sp. VNK21 TaxID=3382483 RepID=UPI0038D478CD
MDQHRIPGPGLTVSDAHEHDLAVRAAPEPTVSPELAALARGSIRTDPDGPLYDSLAQALALDAPGSVDAGVEWNSPVLHGVSSYELRVALSKNLQINSAGDWAGHLGTTLTGDHAGDLETVLQFRAELVRRDGREVGRAQWVEAMHHWAEASGMDPQAHRAMDEISGAVVAVEDRLRSAGLLAGTETVRTAAGVQAADAITVVRWGAQSGYADRPAIVQGLLAVRDLAGRHFVSWREFAASQLAGRALFTAPEQRDRCVDELLPAVATLLLVPESPWRNLEFPIVTDFTELNAGLWSGDPDDMEP